VSEIGLPVFSLSTSTSCSAFSSTTSASLSSACCRSLGVDHRHFSNAFAAAWHASSTSLAEEFGADAYTSPVDEFTISIIWPSDAGWISPPMML
jgi:hypothetical protein